MYSLVAIGIVCITIAFVVSQVLDFLKAVDKTPSKDDARKDRYESDS